MEGEARTHRKRGRGANSVKDGTIQRVKALVFALLALGCVQAPRSSPNQPQLKPASSTVPERYLTIFLIDGLAQDVYQEELRGGGLPHIAALIEDGSYIPRGITSFPSISGYASYPLLTGEIATASGVFGLRWFDRSATNGNFRNYVGRTGYLMNADLRPDTPTLFEQNGGAPSSTYSSLVSRGADRSESLGLDFVLAKYKNESALVQGLNGAVQIFNALPKFGLHDDIATNPADIETKMIARAMAGMATGDRVQFIVFATPDNINHIMGYRTDEGVRPEYVAQLRIIDSLIGAYRDVSAALGTETDRLYLVTSDHGINRTRRNISIVDQLERRYGLAYDRDTAARMGTMLNKRLSDYVDAGVDVIQALQGNNMCFLYFRDPDMVGETAWRWALSYDELAGYPIHGGTDTVDLIDAVAAMEGIELVIHKAPVPGRYRITTRTGVSEIRVEAPDIFSYSVLQGADPLGYDDLPADTPLHEDDWLRLTHEEQYPYAVPLIGHLLSAHPDADMIVTAQPGYDHGLDFEVVVGNYRGGHGGIDATQMVVPFILAGPGVQQGGRLPYARPEDVGNTIQYLMALTPAHPERVLYDILMTPQPPSGTQVARQGRPGQGGGGTNRRSQRK